MNRILSLIGLLCVLAAISIAQEPQSETWRKQPPAPVPMKPLKLPSQIETRLSNGLTTILVEDHRSPIVTIQIAIRVGDADDPPGMPGLAEATAHLLTEGAGARTSEQLAREVESLGGQLSSASNADFTQVGVSVLSESVDKMMDIAGDVLLRPTFPEDEVALYKGNRVQSLTVQRQDPSFLASEAFDKILFGAHPYAISSPTPESIAALDRAKIETFYKSRYTPDGGVLVIVGDFDPGKIAAKARSIFEPWKAPAATASKFPAPPERTTRQIYLVDRPGSEQADIRIGNLAARRSVPDFDALRVANTILGAGTSSRLFLNVREQKGYTYDVSSVVAALVQYGAFFGSTETRTEAALPAIKEVLAEFERMRNQKVSAEELTGAKNFLNGNFSLRLSTQGGVAGQIVETYMFGLGKDFIQNHRASIEAVTDDQVQQAARKYITPDRAAIVLVGDAAKLKKQLETLGPVEMADARAKPGSK